MNSSFSFSRFGVHRGVGRDDLVVLRQVLAVLLDELVDVVAGRPLGEQAHRVGARHHGRGGEGVGGPQHRERLLVAGHHDDAVVRLGVHRLVGRQVVEQVVRIKHEQRVAEVVEAVDVHGRSSFILGA